MTRATLVMLAAAGSAALLLGAFGFQYIGGLHPCELCLLERWPHALAVVCGLAALAVAGRLMPTLGAATMLASTGLGLYHTGVEQKWWEGPTACTSSLDIGGQSAAQLYQQLMTAPIVRCDQVQWSFLHLSMASWNAIASLVLLVIWVQAARKPR